MTDIRCPLRDAAQRYKDLPAVITEGRVIDYGQYDQIVGTAGHRLTDTGATPGERVAVVSPNSVDSLIFLMALFRIGAVACPISPRLPRQTAAEYVRKIGCSKTFDLTGQLPVDKWLGITMLSSARIVDFAFTGTTRLGDHSVPSGRDATIIATSGTSARPKAVLHTYGNHYYSAIGSNKNIKVQPGDRWLLSLPLYHVGGLGILFRTMLGGATVVIGDKNANLLDTIRRYQITHLSLVHTQLYRLLHKKPDRDQIKGLSALLVGGGAVPRALVIQAHEYGLPLFTSYGLTEMASQVTTTRSGDSLDEQLTSGRLLDHREIRISPDGEILVKGDTLFRGYVEQDDIYLPVDGDGWFHTGDVGHFDGAACLTVRGRKDSMFISGGENIHPEEIEETLPLLDDVSEAVVVPVEDDEFGFRPVAFIRTKGNKRVCRSDLITRLEQYLPRFKIPTRFYKWPEIAQNGEVKPSRRYFSELVLSAGNELAELT